MAISMTNSLDTIARVLKKWEAAYKNCQCTDTPDINKLVKEALFESDVTKFKVTATDIYKEENFGIRSTVRKFQNDVIVDWGDGNKTVIKDSAIEQFLDEWESDGQVAFHCTHTYQKPGDYDVTIYGKNYFGVSRNPKYINKPGDTDTQLDAIHTLVSQVFTNKYTIASCVTNLSWFCAFSDMLKEVHFPTAAEFPHIQNISLMFHRCRKLQKVTGMKYKFQTLRSALCVFQWCTSLTECDYKISNDSYTGDKLYGTFRNCTSLKKDIASFFSESGFNPGAVCRCNMCFYNVPLTGTVPAKWFWERTDVDWQLTKNMFGGCPADILSQVPKTWGGTKE